MRWLGCWIVLLVGCSGTTSEPVETTTAAHESPVLPVTFTSPPTAGETREIARIRQALPQEFRSEFLEAKEASYPALSRETSPPYPKSETPFDTTLRTAARHLDALAAQHEDQQRFAEADSIREIADKLRTEARKSFFEAMSAEIGDPETQPENEK